jgi:hypothetical protein
METIRYHNCEKCKNKFATIERLPHGWSVEVRYKNLINEIKKVTKECED